MVSCSGWKYVDAEQLGDFGCAVMRLTRKVPKSVNDKGALLVVVEDR